MDVAQKVKTVKPVVKVAMHELSLKQRAKSFVTKKSFGQNFLVHDESLNLIADYASLACERNELDLVLEIGPGIGFLTDKLLERGMRVVAVDLDKDALSNIPPSLNLQKTHADILQFDFSSIGEPFVVVGNLPFNIATPIIYKLIGDIVSPSWEEAQIPEMVLMFQKEVAQRISASVGSKLYNQMSIAMQAKSDIQYLFEVSAGSFHPVPKVDAAVISLVQKQHSILQDLLPENRKKLDLLLKLSFQQRRKILKNSLQSQVPSEKWESIGIDPMLRPQNLSLEDFVKIVQSLD